ncbi:hypothetical protein Ancab_005289 [Ancistrocladus abbreviatus]
MVVKAEEEEGDNRKRWGTWEELILGGAVLRHGTNDWDAVSSELQTRSIHPFLFTPQVCKAKYKDLQQRYSGSTAWFEELRKRRVAELKRALEKSEDSIGSLESKLESLKAEKGSCSNAVYSSSQTESPVPFLKSEGNEISGKDVSKDGLSAGSFTQETQANWSPQCQDAVDVSAEQAEVKPLFQSSTKEQFHILDKLAQAIRSEGGVSIRKKRGERKRKDCSKDIKKGSVGEKNNLGSANVAATTLQCKEILTSDCGETARPSGANDQEQGTSNQGLDLITILDSVMQNEHALVFKRRLDSQKRARYKKIVRQHMDLDMIRSRITQKSITSAKELFRDLLLIANNALVFYSKSTREYKCASRLRVIVIKRLSQHHKASGNTSTKAVAATTTAVVPKSPMHKTPAKPRSARPFNHKSTDKTINTKNANPALLKAGKSSSSAADSPQSMESSTQLKKTPGHRGGKVRQVKRGNAGLQAETPMRVRKRGRAR